MPYKLKSLKKGKWKIFKSGFKSFDSAYRYAEKRFGKNNPYYPIYYTKSKRKK